MKKIREVIRLRFDRKASISEIASSCKMGRTTVGEYLQRAVAAKISWPVPEGLSDADLESALFPREPLAAPGRPLPDWNVVRRDLGRKGVTLLLLWQEYIERFPNGYGYTRYTMLFKEWLSLSELVMLQHHTAGEKLFVDWAGQKMDVRDPQTGEAAPASVFVSAMGSSQFIFAKACESEDSKNWLSCHDSAFDFYGALPEVVVPDNLKTGVHSPSYYEPALNPAYAELAAFYGLAIVPARVRKPRDKAKVENAVLQVERWVLAPLRDRTFFSLDELNEAIYARLEDLNGRLMKGPQASRKELFALEDRPAMRDLPVVRYVYAQWKPAKLGPDYHVEVDGHRYSVPFTLVGKRVDVRVSHGTVEVFHGSRRVASHARSLKRRGHTTQDCHMPEKHSKQARWTPQRFMRWAESIGPSVEIFVSAALEGKLHPEHAFRMCMGVMKLEKSFGKERLNAACARAYSAGAFSYASVKSILEKNLENVPVAEVLNPLPNHGNVRGGSYYAREDLCAKSR